jgi:hypothetical protein
LSTVNVKKFRMSFDVFSDALVQLGGYLTLACHSVKAVALIDVAHESSDNKFFFDCFNNQNTTGSDAVSFSLFYHGNFENDFGKAEDFF